MLVKLRAYFSLSVECLLGNRVFFEGVRTDTLGLSKSNALKQVPGIQTSDAIHVIN
jgi:hypothetical protein